MRFPERGLYAITQTDNKTPETVICEVTAAIRGGAVIVQYRDKSSQDKVFLGSELLKVCRRYGVPLIINDDIELAATLGADGVHLGKEDGDILLAKSRLGSDAIIGVSCYNSVERAVAMQLQGATYAAFGRFFASSSKPLAAAAELATLKQAKQLLNIPIVAIGGILPDNGGQLVSAGANLLAVIGGLFDNQPGQSATKYARLFQSESP